MSDAKECKQRASACVRLSRGDIDPRAAAVLLSVATSWNRLAGQMERLAERDPAVARRLAQPRWWITG
jgi:hypothetical protein